MKLFRYLGIASIACCIFACGGTPTPTEPTGPSTENQQPVAAKEKYLILNYDDLRMRETPNKAGNVLATLKEGAEVLDLGERSEDNETVTLRGKAITAPWAKVRSKEGVEGWVFSGAFSAAPDPAVSNFSKSLKEISTKDCGCLRKALDQYAASMKGQSAETADLSVVPLFDFFEDYLVKLNNETQARPDFTALEHLGYTEPGKAQDPKALAQKADWEKCGLQLYFPEGMLNLVLKPGFAISTLDPVVSDGMRKYLQTRKKEDQNVWSEDGGLTISPRELADRAIAWELFLNDYPTFIYNDNIRQMNHFYVGTLLSGMDNTPAFENADGVAEKSYQEAWDWILKEHAKTDIGKTVAEYVGLLKGSAMKPNAKSRGFVQKYWGEGE